MGAAARPSRVPAREAIGTDRAMQTARAAGPAERDAEETGWTEPDVLLTSYHAARDRLIARFERRYLTMLVERAGGNVSRAARMAGVDRTTIYRLMARHGLTVDRLLQEGEVPASGPEGE
jgi:DNA-binding NtrC family response regulator